MSHQQTTQEQLHNLNNISCSSTYGNTSSSSLTSLVPGGVVTTQNISTVIKPKENNNSMQFVKITPPDLGKKAVEQIRVAQESKITKDKLKEVEEEWQSNLLKWKSKRRQHFVGPIDSNDGEQNNNNVDNSTGRKVKTFAQIIEQRARAGNRLNFNLQRYIGSEDEDESVEQVARSDNCHPPDLDEANDGRQDQRDPLEEPKDIVDHVTKSHSTTVVEELIPTIEPALQLEPKPPARQHSQASSPQAKDNTQQQEVKPAQKLETTRQMPQLKPLPRPPSSPKPHLEMLKQKFESLTQPQQAPPLPVPRPVSTNRPEPATQKLVQNKPTPLQSQQQYSHQPQKQQNQLPQLDLSRRPSIEILNCNINNNNNNDSVNNSHQSMKQKEEKDRTVLSVSGKRRCSSCKEELGRGAAAFVVESLNLVYHTNCFKCSVCHVDLSNGFRGVDVRVHAGALHCQNCYSKDGLNYSRV